ncbi:MXAN_6640 family putative metalloprotease [Sandaracinus amylolyticus]|uniref:Uncharacterized protein n=1 Tax=Sandaracinus amylolyticus TaxID=927083 RepID=A0A0F6W233_9BACT|nr:MXAN_6640 family putative metalloprotease [Sandaracinus amylolyticus]AKF05333.1 hypothetical protein DB32_002482 [Sandaracinus amylolyticus]
MRLHAVALAVIVASCAPPIAGSAEIALRPDDVRATAPRFDEGDEVERFDSPGGAFAIHFTRAGTHTVPLADADADGVPDFVQEVAATYDEALAFYVSLGLRAPLGDEGVPEGDGGDGRLDVYLVNFGGGSTGAFRRDVCTTTCIGHVVQENDFAGYGFASRRSAVRILASHELFHAVQAAYDADQSAVLGEGSAVWASEAFDPTLEDLEAFSDSYLGATDRSIEQSATGPVDPYTYGAGVFFEFLAERYGPELVVGVVRDVEDGARGVADPRWIDVLSSALERDHATTFEAAWLDHARWNLRTGRRADPEASYERGAMLAELAIEALPVPYADTRVRMLRGSSRSYRVTLGSRARVGVDLLEPMGREGATEGLFVLVTPETDGVIGATRTAPASEGPHWIDASEGESAIVTIVRALDEDDGAGRAPAMCIGSEVELAGCRDVMTMVDAGTPVDDAGMVTDAGIAPPTSSSGCDCTVARGGSSRGWLLALVLVAALRRRV